MNTKYAILNATVNVILFFGLFTLSTKSSNAEDEDIDHFKRIKRIEMIRRTPDQIGNKFSIKHPGMRLLKPRFQGNGCKESETVSVLSSDKRIISILFNNYIVQAGSSVDQNEETKNCEVLLPIVIPPGHRLAVIGLDYRGFAAIPTGGKALLKTNYQFFNQNNLPISRRVVRSDEFKGPYEDSYYLTSLLKDKKYWSECGRNIDLKIKIILSAYSNLIGNDTLATLDSIDGDLNEDLTYHLLWEKCQGN